MLIAPRPRNKADELQRHMEVLIKQMETLQSAGLVHGYTEECLASEVSCTFICHNLEYTPINMHATYVYLYIHVYIHVIHRSTDEWCIHI